MIVVHFSFNAKQSIEHNISRHMNGCFWSSKLLMLGDRRNQEMARDCGLQWCVLWQFKFPAQITAARCHYCFAT